jgi:hypothetical protein
MTRRDLLPTMALIALPELTGAASADERLTLAVEVWQQADATLADQRATYDATTRALRTTRLLPLHRVKALVETRRSAREELEAGARALAEAEVRLEQAARLVRSEP